eukprot:821807-Prymnesium_polylepis.1
MATWLAPPAPTPDDPATSAPLGKGAKAKADPSSEAAAAAAAEEREAARDTAQAAAAHGLCVLSEYSSSQYDGEDGGVLELLG